MVASEEIATCGVFPLFSLFAGDLGSRACDMTRRIAVLSCVVGSPKLRVLTLPGNLSWLVYQTSASSLGTGLHLSLVMDLQ